MQRAWTLFLLAGLLSACTAAQASQPAGQSQRAGVSEAPAPGGGGGSGSSIAAAAISLVDACKLMPADLAAKIVPGASAPQSQTFPPLRCTVSNGVAVLEITIDLGSGAVEPIPGAEVIPGLGEAAYFERLLPDDAYLTIVLGKNPNAALHIEVAGHDGKDHKDDAVKVGEAALARLR